MKRFSLITGLVVLIGGLTVSLSFAGASCCNLPGADAPNASVLPGLWAYQPGPASPVQAGNVGPIARPAVAPRPVAAPVPSAVAGRSCCGQSAAVPMATRAAAAGCCAARQQAACCGAQQQAGCCGVPKQAGCCQGAQPTAAPAQYMMTVPIPISNVAAPQPAGRSIQGAGPVRTFW